MSEHIIHVSDESFEQEVLQSDNRAHRLLGGVVRPCKMIAPVLMKWLANTRTKSASQTQYRRESATPPKHGIEAFPR